MHPEPFVLWGWRFSSYWTLVWAGYALGVLWLRTQVRHDPGKDTPKLFWGFVAVIVSAAMLGGKLGFFLVEWRTLLTDPGLLLEGWTSGWVFWTGLLSALAAGLGYQYWYNATHRPRRYLPVGDYVVVALPLGHALGRVGCFLDGCCHGRPTSLPWAATFTDPICGVADELLGVPLHPVQLYEAAGELALFLFFAYWVLPRVRAYKLREGTAFFGYILAYSVLRFGLEFLRGDDRGFLLSAALSPSQWLSLGAGLAAAAVLWRRGVRHHGPKWSFYSDGKA